MQNPLEQLRKSWVVIPAMGIYTFLVWSLRFVQDDSYITYRYIANYLNGHGLVYNIGEYVEGFTNFGWLIYLLLFGSLGIDYIIISQVSGYIFGLGIIYMTWLIAQKLIDRDDQDNTIPLYWILPVLLVGTNLSLAYWSAAGLETAAFAFMAMLAFYCFLIRSRWFLFAILIAVWLRPEGGLIAILLLIIEVIQTKRLPRFVLSYGFLAFVLSLPYVAFKLYYYGSIFPNPFYAKTGLSLVQVSSGFEYIMRFMSHYGFYGFGLIVPFVVYRRLSSEARAVLWFVSLYLLYILAVGGDVLKVHRFYLPLFGLYAILVTIGLKWLITFISASLQKTLFIVVGLIMILLTVYLPYQFVSNYNRLEKDFVTKMGKMAKNMLQSDSTDFSVALPTIGRFGYDLIGHDIIDMVGLTDSTIARHSEEPILGMETTWKESKHNSSYLLGRAPEYIMFSTGVKPSAPAERALLLYREFQDSYRTIGWYFELGKKGSRGLVHNVFKRVRQPGSNPKPYYAIEFVEYYNEGMNHYSAGKWASAIKSYRKAASVSPQCSYPEMLCNMAFCLGQLEKYETAIKLLDAVVKEDSLTFEAHRFLYIYAGMMGDSAKLEVHRKGVLKMAPWYLPRLDSLLTKQLANLKRSSR